ncbi:28_t:CDS:2, partial [Paraglomus occultum]
MPAPQPGPESEIETDPPSVSESNNQEELWTKFLKYLGITDELQSEDTPTSDEIWSELGGTLLADKPPKGDPERLHRFLQSMSKWQAIVSSIENPAYEFNIPIEDGQKYAEVPYTVSHNSWHQPGNKFQGFLRRNLEKKGEVDRDTGEIDKKIEEFLRSGSGWTLIRIEMMFIEAYTLRRAESGSYRPTPKNLANKKCTINPDNSKTKDDLCLKYAVGAYFANYEGITKNLQRLSIIQPYLNRVNLDGIPMPTPICNRTFQKIEAQNPAISINVWEWKNETATPKPVIASKNFYIPNSCTIDGCIHSNPNKCHKKRPHVIYLMALSDTMKTDGEAPQKVSMPEKGKNDIEKFKNYARMIYAPCVITADFESDNKKCDKSYGDTGETWGPFIYRGPNATQEFVKRIDSELVRINEVLAIKVGRIVTDEYQRKFDKADKCWICHKELNGDKVWDHCHITSKFRGALHNDCNLKLQITPWKTPVPIVFHNFRGYDSHLICESVGRSVNAKQINVIAETFERYKSMRVGQLRYIDSMQFMNTSLAKLAENLGAVKCKESNCKHFHRIDDNRCFGTLENHKITCQIYKNLSPKQIALVCRKGVYPYEYIDSHDRFSETELPPFHEFHGKLNGKISQKDYDYAQKVWNEFGCKNL